MSSRTSSPRVGAEPAAPAQGGGQLRAKPLTREQERSRRRREVRGHSINISRLPRWELELGKRLYPPEDNAWKPRTRADCASVPRPCPYVSCRHHLYLDVNEQTGSIKLNFPDLEVDELEESCSLDIADRGGTSLGDVGGAMNLTRERVRQIERSGMLKIDSLAEMETLRDYVEGTAKGVRGRVQLTADDFLEEEGDEGGAEEDGPVRA